jgi:hypothetical protein
MVDTATTVETVVEGTENTVETTTGIEQKPFIVGEHSVYTSVEDLYQGAIQKEQFIQKLKRENEELNARLQQLNTDETLRQELLNIRKDAQMTDVNMGENTTAPITDDTIKEIALKAMQESAEAQRQANNLQECKSLLGTTDADVDVALKNKASELGVTTDDLVDMAAKKPQLFKRLFDIKETTRTSDFIPSSVRTVNTTQVDNYGEFIKNANDKRYVATMVEKALKDPSFVSGWEWKVNK